MRNITREWMNVKALAFVVLLTLARAKQGDEYVRFCYYTNFSGDRLGAARFLPEDIDPFLCTHISFAFANITNNNEITEGLPNDRELYVRINRLKEINPSLKTILSVGGWAFGMGQVSTMLETAESRATFIKSAVIFLRTNQFDGMDLDFEYPGDEGQGGRPADKNKFSDLTKEMKTAFKNESAKSRNPQLLLTAAVACRKPNIDKAYQVSVIAQHLDYINLMAYDFHGVWENFTGLNAPLRPRQDEQGDHRYLNVEYSVNYWIDSGARPEQIVLGLGFFGKSFMLSSNNTGLGAPVSGPGPIRGDGVYNYVEICTERFDHKVFNEEQLAPYGWKTDGLWIGYDDKRSFACKINFMEKMKLAGFFVWAIDLDDFNGAFCGEGAYPLMNYILSLITSGGDPESACNGGQIEENLI